MAEEWSRLKVVELKEELKRRKVRGWGGYSQAFDGPTHNLQTVAVRLPRPLLEGWGVVGRCLLLSTTHTSPLLNLPNPPPLQLKLTDFRNKPLKKDQMIRLLLEFTTTPGTLGVLAAHEGDNYFGFNRHGIALGIVPNKTFAGTPRMYASAVRTVVSKVETDFRVEVRLLLSFTSVGRRNALCKLVFLSSSILDARRC